MSKALHLSGWQVFFVILLSLLFFLAAVVFFSIYWPAEKPVERMAAGAFLAPVVWLYVVCRGLIFTQLRWVFVWLGIPLLALIGFSALSFIGK